MKNYKLIILAFLEIIFVFSCKKSPLNYTAQMAGMHIWHGTFDHEDAPFTYQDTFYNITNDTFSIIVINNSAITLGGDTLKYISSTNSTTSFVGYDYTNSYRYTAPATYDSIAYNHANNSIYYYTISYNPGGITTIILETP
jgi:hypothetical protein